MKNINIPAILLLAAIAVIATLASGCETRKTEPASTAPTPRPSERPKPPSATQAERTRYPVRPCTDADEDPAGSPDWFDEELRRIEWGLDESQKAPEERGKPASR